MSDEKQVVETQVDEKQVDAESTEPSSDDIQELAELLRQTRELRMRTLRLAVKYGACDYAGDMEYDERPFQRALQGVVGALGEAAVSANAYLVGQVLGDSHLTCVCGSGDWTKYRALGPDVDGPACAQCENCGLRVTLQVLPAQPLQEPSGDDIPF